MPALTRGQTAMLAISAVATVVAGIVHYAGGADLLAFVLAAVALAGLAWVVSFATEQVGERFGPAVTGFLQSTLGNLPEFFIVIFALSAGQTVVAQTSILGSLFANALLVLGLVVVFGQGREGVMRFRRRLPMDTTTLLLVAVFIIVVVGLAVQSHEEAGRHIETLSAIAAVCLLVVYAAWTWSYLRSDEPREEAHGGDAAAHAAPLAFSLVLLAVAGVGAALVSDWFIAALQPSIDQLGISQAFAGLVIVAIAGNAVENFTGIALAAKGESDLAISVVKNSVAQIAAFLFPALVLVSLLFETTLTFNLAPVYIGALFLTAIAIWQITGDGEALRFEGFALIALYLVLAAFAWLE